MNEHEHNQRTSTEFNLYLIYFSGKNNVVDLNCTRLTTCSLEKAMVSHM